MRLTYIALSGMHDVTFNFLNEPDDDRLRASYGATKYDRLAQIKSKYDPDNRLHLNANIKPTR